MTNFEDEAIVFTAPRKDFFVVTNDHGGYLEGFCFACKKHGWEDKINHASQCPVKIPSSAPDKVSDVMRQIQLEIDAEKDMTCIEVIRNCQRPIWEQLARRALEESKRI